MGRAASDVDRIERKREKTETVGTGFAIAAVVVAADGLMEGLRFCGEELFVDVGVGRAVDDEFCGKAAAEARLASDC